VTAGPTPEASAFLQAVTAAGVPAVLPPPVEEHEELWAALKTLQDRLDTVDAVHAWTGESDLEAAQRLRVTGLGMAAPIVQALVANRFVSSADEAASALISITATVFALLSPPSLEE